MNRRELFFKLNLDYDNITIVKKLAEYYVEWCRLNKSYESVEVLKPKHFKTIVVIHNMYDNCLKTIDSWEFVSDVKYFLKLYSNESDENYEFMMNFWKNKVERLNKL